MESVHGTARRKLRVGSVPYFVGRPLDLGLAEEPAVEMVRRVPAELVALLRAGELDVALVSSIELFRRPGYRYLDGLAVAAAGFVASVQVFLRRPIEAVRSVALDPSSCTAAALVQVLLSDVHDLGGAAGASEGGEQRVGGLGIGPDFVEVASGSDPREAGTDAWLRIGDPALREYLSADRPPVFNPAQEWFARTRLPFAFAVWIVRPGIELATAEIAAFARSREVGLTRIGALAEEASRTWGLPLSACRKYLVEECRFEPGADLARALLLFRDRAARLGLCRADLAPPAIRGAAEHVA